MDEKRKTRWERTGAWEQLSGVSTDSSTQDTKSTIRNDKLKPFRLLKDPMASTGESPLKDHAAVMRADQAGPILIMRSRSNTAKMVAVRRLEGQQKADVRHLRRCAHENLVSCQQIHCWNSTVYLIEELLRHAVSLSALMRSPRTQLGTPEVSVISHSILSAISQLHAELSMPHGNLEPANVLITSDGKIKLANWMRPTSTLDREDLNTDLERYADIVEALIDTADLPEKDTFQFRSLAKQARSKSHTAKDLLQMYKWDRQMKTTLQEQAFVADTIDFPSVTVFPVMQENMAIEDFW